MAGTSDTFPGGKDIIRFVRFAPWHLSHAGPELDSWVTVHVPHGIESGERHISRHINAAQLNVRYARTLEEVGKCRLRRRPALTLLTQLIHEGDAAVNWKRSGAADCYTRERKAEDDFLAHRKEAAHAARTLARAFSNRSSLADWTVVLAFMKGMDEVPIPDWPADGDGRVPTALATPFLNWKRPTPAEEENPRTADYLVALMARLAQECEVATPGGYHRRRHGPFYYPAGTTPPRDGNDLLVNGLLYVAVRATRQATGAPVAPDAGAPMMKGGHPFYRLAAAYVQDVTEAAHPRGEGTELCPVTAYQRLAKLLSRNPGLVCRGWAADEDR